VRLEGLGKGSLSDKAVSNSNYIGSNDWMIVSNEL
jgi:hypothetical protein